MLGEKEVKLIRQMREAGLSFRQIGEKLDIPHTLAFYYSKNVRDEHNEIHVQLVDKILELLESNQKVDGAVIEIGDVGFILFEMPYRIPCLYCGKASKYLVACMNCGIFVCQNCGEGVDLGAARLERELSLT